MMQSWLYVKVGSSKSNLSSWKRRWVVLTLSSKLSWTKDGFTENDEEDINTNSFEENENNQYKLTPGCAYIHLYKESFKNSPSARPEITYSMSLYDVSYLLSIKLHQSETPLLLLAKADFLHSSDKFKALSLSPKIMLFKVANDVYEKPIHSVLQSNKNQTPIFSKEQKVFNAYDILHLWNRMFTSVLRHYKFSLPTSIKFVRFVEDIEKKIAPKIVKPAYWAYKMNLRQKKGTISKKEQTQKSNLVVFRIPDYNKRKHLDSFDQSQEDNICPKSTGLFTKKVSTTYRIDNYNETIKIRNSGILFMSYQDIDRLF